jgi:hypothetical protein
VRARAAVPGGRRRRPSWNDIIFGAIVFVLGIVAATAGAEQPHRAQPWYRR